MKFQSSAVSRTNYLEHIRRAPRRLIVGVMLMLASSLTGSMLMRQDAETHVALQALRAVAAGEYITAADVRPIRISAALDSAGWATFDDLSAPQRLIRATRPGQPLFASDLGGAASGEVTFAFEISAATVPRQVDAGTEVQLWAVGTSDTFEAELISSQATLLEVAPIENRETTRVSLRVAPQFLAHAIQMAAENRLRLVSTG